MKISHITLSVLAIILALSLRLYIVSRIAPSLYWDEVSLGYNAFSILNSGYDEHQEYLPLGRFIAYGDFKPPGYIYATVPSIFIFGASEIAVRLPSVVAGVILSFCSYYLALYFFNRRKIALLAVFLTAISIWSIQLSRGAFEANLGACFNSLAVLFLLKTGNKKGYFVVLSIVFFVLSFYTFNANRIIAPILLLLLSIYKFKDIWKVKWWLVAGLVIALMMIWPSRDYLLSRESKVRLQEVSIFTDLKTLEKSNSRIIRDPGFLSPIINNRRVSYFTDWLVHYFSHFRPDYLFSSGDGNPRLSIQAVGEIYLACLPFLIIGLLYSVKNYGFRLLPLFIWLAVSVIPSSVSRETPHMLRTASIIPIFDIFIAYGLYILIRKFSTRGKRGFILLICTLFILNIFYYLHNYYIHYPIKWAGQWQYGYKETVEKVRQIEKDYDYIVVSDYLGRPYIYFLYYNQIKPGDYSKTRIASRDWFGFWTVSGFGKYRFGGEWLMKLSGKILFVGSEGETKNMNSIIDTITYPTGETVFKLIKM